MATLMRVDRGTVVLDFPDRNFEFLFLFTKLVKFSDQLHVLF